MCVAFVDYEKAFDSVQTQAILTSLQEQGIEDEYIEIMKDIYGQLSDSTSHKESDKISIKRGVRQGPGHHLTQSVHSNIGEHNYLEG